jgi:hypothetical protein
MLAEMLKHHCPDPDLTDGFATPLPAISDADPCTGSNIEGKTSSGFRFADGAMPIVPVHAGPRSERTLLY